MTDWPSITDAQCDPDAPLTSDLVYGLRDGPRAITEGAVGAPRIEDIALSTSASAAGVTWVGNRIQFLDVYALGSVLMLAHQSLGGAAFDLNSLVLGSSLKSASAGGHLGSFVPPGTWKCLGACIASGADLSASNRVTLWRRVL